MKKITLLFLVLVLFVAFSEAKKHKSNKNYKKQESNYNNKINNKKYDRRNEGTNKDMSYQHEKSKHSDHAKDKWSKKYNKHNDVNYEAKSVQGNQKHETKSRNNAELKVKEESVHSDMTHSKKYDQQKKEKYHYRKHGKKYEKVVTSNVEDANLDLGDVQNKRYESSKSHKYTKKDKKDHKLQEDTDKQNVENLEKLESNENERVSNIDKKIAVKEKSKQGKKDKNDAKFVKESADEQIVEAGVGTALDDIPSGEDLQFVSKEKVSSSSDEEQPTSPQESDETHADDEKLSESAVDVENTPDEDITSTEEERTEVTDANQEEADGELLAAGLEDKKCQRDSDCGAGWCCHVGGQGARGTCQQYMKGVGEKCVSECQCEPGLTCLFPQLPSKKERSDRGVCVPPQ